MKSRRIEAIFYEQEKKKREKQRLREKNLRLLKEVYKKWLSKRQPTKPKNKN